MATDIRSLDIVLWLKAMRPHADLHALDWGASPLRGYADAAGNADHLSFAAEAILANAEASSKFLRALAQLRARSPVTVVASVAVHFGEDKLMQTFRLPPDLIGALGDALDDVEICVYSTSEEGASK